MSIVQAFTGAISGTFADQWKEIVTVGRFDEQTAVMPGILRQSNNSRGVNTKGSHAVISKGSKIYVPENTAAFIFSDGGIEDIITRPGGYVFHTGQSTIFQGEGLKDSLFDQVINRIGYGGQPSEQKLIAFVNLREIRGLRFGTRGALVYNDLFYGTDLEITAFGTFSLRIVDVVRFVRNFLPANVYNYSFASARSRQQVVSEFLQSFTVALNSLSSTYRISQLPSQAHMITDEIKRGSSSAGQWRERFGIEIVGVGIEAIEFTEESRALVKQYAENRMTIRGFEGVDQQTSNVSAQQKIAQGVQDHGLGTGGGMLFGMNLAQGISPLTGQPAAQAAAQSAGQTAEQPVVPPVTPPVLARVLSFDEQVDAVTKMKGLLDAGLLTDEEFAIKKKEILGF